MLLNVAFSELKMKKGKVVLTNGGSIQIKVERMYKTGTGKTPSDWNWDNEIYLERIQ